MNTKKNKNFCLEVATNACLKLYNIINFVYLLTRSFPIYKGQHFLFQTLCVFAHLELHLGASKWQPYVPSRLPCQIFDSEREREGGHGPGSYAQLPPFR